jgi:uncharacterized repeat protein (TIGR01451 family)
MRRKTVGALVVSTVLALGVSARAEPHTDRSLGPPIGRAELQLTASNSPRSANPIVEENRLPGTAEWKLGLPGFQIASDAAGQVQGYATTASVEHGEQLTFRITVNPVQSYTIDFYRMGWYGGLGARLMDHVGPFPGVHQPRCTPDSTYGLIACDWSDSYVRTVPADWTTGVYVAKLTNERSYQSYIMFVVRNDQRPGRMMYQVPFNTYQAYNRYPNDGVTGKDCYPTSNGPDTVTGTAQAAKVSFDRPFSTSRGSGAPDPNIGGVGQKFFQNDIQAIRWMERTGFDVSYTTDLDTATNGDQLLNTQLFIAGGKDEYWSLGMREAVETARDSGVNLAFLGADDMLWQVRYEDSDAGVPYRVMVCYKNAARDPVQGPTTTTNWRAPPVNWPEQQTMGVQYFSVGGFPSGYIIPDASLWPFDGSGMRDGDSIRWTPAAEVDAFMPQYQGPDATSYQTLARYPVERFGETEHTIRKPELAYAESSLYQAASGAYVFASGSMYWSAGLDDYKYRRADPRLQRMAENLFVRFTEQADLRATVSGPDAASAAGESLAYRVTIMNAGPDEASAVRLQDEVPTGTTLVSAVASNGGTCSGVAEVRCDLGSIGLGETVFVDLVVRAEQQGPIIDTARVEGQQTDPAPGNNAATTDTGIADLSVSLSAPGATGSVGAPIPLKVTVTNIGSDPAYDVELSVALPPGVVPTSRTAPTGCRAGGIFTCDLGALASGATAERTILATPVTNLPVTTRAEVRTPTSDPANGNDRASIETEASGAACTIVGSPDPDVLVGGPLPDVICGLAGDDSMAGRNGNDTLLPGIGDDSVDGGVGTDTVSYLEVTGNNTFYGKDGGDSISGGDGNDTLYPGVGDDSVNGGVGADMVAYSDLPSGAAGVMLNLGITGPQDTMGAGTDTISTIENAAGTNGFDTLTGNPGANTIYGKDGDDTVDGGNGNDVLYPGTGNDSVNGGAGLDTVNYSDLTAGVIVKLSGSFTGDEAGTDTLSLIERATGTNFSDMLTGDNTANILKGLSGNDSIFGLDGNDTLDGGIGTDTLDGGNGTDICKVGEVKTNCEA